MPKRKITLTEAFEVFEEHGLHVTVDGLRQEPADLEVTPADLIVHEQGPVLPQKERAFPASQQRRTLQITLHARHKIGSGGFLTVQPGGGHTITQSVQHEYGPGVCRVPIELAQHLLHQDALARQGDERTFDRKFRSYLVVQSGGLSIGKLVSEDQNFDMSGFLGSLGNYNSLL